MTPALIYLLFLVILILVNGCFGLFSDEHLSRRKIATVLFLKAMAVPVFFFVYNDHYGGLSAFDTGKFYNDAEVLNSCARKHPLVFAKLWLGIEEQDAEQNACLAETQNWLSGRDGKFFYNDNRVLIRIHSLLHFIAFRSWHVHALFSCFFGFVGLFWLYKSFKSYLAGKETKTIFLLCFLPALWFYSGALLKEGVVLFVLGAGTLLIRTVVTRKATKTRIFVLLVLLLLGSLLKPYLLVTGFLCFAWFFHLQHKATIKRRSVYYVALLLLLFFVADKTLSAIKDTDVRSVIYRQQRTFSGASSGGIYLAGDSTYLRLAFDTTLVKKVDGKKFRYTVRGGARYMYWKDSENRDTLYNKFNTDTTSEYELAFKTPKGTSNYSLPDLREHPFRTIIAGFYYALFHPFFLNADNALQMLASFENLVVLMAIWMVLYGMVRRKKSRLLPTAFMCFALAVCLIVSLSSPNSGAVFRYRAPAVIFILLAALYYFEPYANRKAADRGPDGTT